jgi:uncharacterized repeat protein (TIGR03837 family)
MHGMSDATQARPSAGASGQRWDVFCVAIDNYGDVGVAWRLARQLASEHRFEVTLWVDALATLGRLARGIAQQRGEQYVNGVTVRHWNGPNAETAAVDVADVVVESFGCGLPESYLHAMAQRSRQPVWINLEYLSAEDWVERCHGLASPQPRLPLTRHFFFPGFTAHTGGLLRETSLLPMRDAAEIDSVARGALWRALGLPVPAADGLVVSLFCYPNPVATQLFDAWADGDEPVRCIVPEGVATAAIDAWTGGDVPQVGQMFRHGRLELAAVPFVSQDEYDRTLWACDVNFVRGEDSFVRAQWAAQPFVWQPYPQEEDAHRLKLEAFVARFLVGLDAQAAAALTALWPAWNGSGDVGAAWPAFASARDVLATHGRRWADEQASHPDLASVLVKFAQSRV